MADLGSLITSIGFPAAIAVYLLYRQGKDNERVLSLMERYRTDSIDLSKLMERAIEALNRNTGSKA